MEDILRLVGAATGLGIEIQAAVRKSAGLEHLQHAQGGLVDVGGELIGVPAQQQIALIGVDGAERPVDPRHGQLVLEGVARQGGVVGLDVQLEVLVQPVFA